MYISALAGYVGVIFLLWMYILGAKSAMGVIFKDLASVISIHKKLGKWGSIAFLLHPIFVSYSYYDLSAKSLVYIVWPEISTQFDRWVTLGRVAFFLLLMVWLTSKLYRKKLGFRVWKYLHYFAYIALPFVLLHIPGIGSQYLAHPLVRVYYILIVGVFLLFSLFRISAWLNLDRTKYIITSSRQITPEDFVMTLQPADKPLKIKIGQYVYVKVGMISEDRPFSVTHRDIKTDVLTVTYRVYGSFTKYLTTLRPHTVVSLAGPFGEFTSDIIEYNSRPAVYIAGGVDITPFVQRITDENTMREQWLFAANRTHASAVLVPQMQQLMGERCVPIYSREPAAPGEEYGHVSAELFQKYLAQPTAYSYYICGPKAFIRETQAILASLNVPDSQVHSEKFSW